MSTDLCCIEEKKDTEVILRIVDKESKEVGANLHVAFAYLLNKEKLKILIDGHLCEGGQFMALYSYLFSIWRIMGSALFVRQNVLNLMPINLTSIQHDSFC